MRDKNHIRIDTHSTAPAYRQIVDQLRVLIVEERLRPGDPLPPVRALALELGVHFNTAAEAYRTLAQEGLLDITHGRGARVVDRSVANSPPQKRQSAEFFRKRLREVVAEFRAKGLSARQIERELRGVSEVLGPVTHMPSSAVMYEMWRSGLSLCIAGYGWIFATRWANSESVFFGVRTVMKFEDTSEAQKIDSRYLHEIVTLTGALILLSILLLLSFRQLLPSVHPYSFWPLALVQAFGVRIAYLRARNRTLPFAAPAGAVRTADLASLAPASRTWNLFYWPSVYLPLLAIAAMAFYLRSHWASVPFPYAIAFPITGSTAPIAWSLGAVLRAYWILILALLVNIAGVLVAHGFSFHSRINEWGEDDEQRGSYRKLLMIATTVAPTWDFTALVVVIALQIRVLPRKLDTGLDQLWVFAFLICLVLMIVGPLYLGLLLYFKRPVGTVNRGPDDCWKLGLYYFNPQDGAWIVPARFGSWFALNYGQPLAWVLLLISVACLGLGWHMKSPTPNYKPNDSVQSQFATATLQLRGGDFAASDRLLYMARHNNDPAIWSSVAYELADNHVKPDSARQSAERAVAQGERDSSQTHLATTNAEDGDVMARLAAYWSNLGYVCSSQGDLNCAQRYLDAAWALDPLPAYRDELAAVLKAVPNPQDRRIPATLEFQSGVPA